MLKLSKIYSNSDSIFPKISFKDGLNIIFASVTKELDSRDSHCLGKTLLADLLDYMLIKQINKKNEFFLTKHEVFKDFEFFLEIQVNESSFITIKRPVSGKVFLHQANKKKNLAKLQDNKWKFSGLGINAAKKELNNLVNLTVVDRLGFSYRNGIRYCIRRQNQYSETFKVNSSRESDAQWKPYLAGLLGIDSEIVRKKYSANTDFENIKNAIKQIETLPQASTQSIEAEIAQIESSLSRRQNKIDKFDFSKSDIEINKELINDVGRQISEFNKKLYVLDRKVSAIDNSLKARFEFDIDKLIELYDEIQLHFPEALIKEYNDLIELNKQMTSGRKKRLKKAKIKLLEERDELTVTLKELNLHQSKLSKLLVEKNLLEKYKSMQKMMSGEEARLAVLKDRVNKLDAAEQLKKRLKDAQLEKDKYADKIDKKTRLKENKILSQAVSVFSDYVEKILYLDAFFFAKTNKEGNPEFKINLKDQTSVSEGFSYKRILSAIFDVMLLAIYSKDSFYRFAYHDGLLESLDDRIKLRLLSQWRKISKKHDLQLIISVLDSDLPLDSKGEKIYFSQVDIIRELHDQGDDGRLFKMKAF